MLPSCCIDYLICCRDKIRVILVLAKSLWMMMILDTKMRGVKYELP